MPKCKYPLEQTEKELGTWTTNMIIPDAGRYNGDLTATDQRLIFLSKYKFDFSLAGLMGMAFFESIGEQEYMIIPRKDIQSVTPKKSFISKRAIVMMKNGEEMIIDYGMLNIDPILKALGV